MQYRIKGIVKIFRNVDTYLFCHFVYSGNTKYLSKFLTLLLLQGECRKNKFYLQTFVTDGRFIYELKFSEMSIYTCFVILFILEKTKYLLKCLTIFFKQA